MADLLQTHCGPLPSEERAPKEIHTARERTREIRKSGAILYAAAWYIHYKQASPFFAYRIAVPFWEQTTCILNASSPKRNCSLKACYTFFVKHKVILPSAICTAASCCCCALYTRRAREPVSRFLFYAAFAAPVVQQQQTAVAVACELLLTVYMLSELTSCALKAMKCLSQTSCTLCFPWAVPILRIQGGRKSGGELALSHDWWHRVRVAAANIKYGVQR